MKLHEMRRTSIFLVRFSAASILKIREITRQLLFVEDNLPTVFADAAILTTKCTLSMSSK